MKFLSSIEFAIIILILIIIGSIIGAIIPQNWEEEKYIKKYGYVFAGFLIKQMMVTGLKQRSGKWLFLLITIL